jgi:hypothetical protein
LLFRELQLSRSADDLPNTAGDDEAGEYFPAQVVNPREDRRREQQPDDDDRRPDAVRNRAKRVLALLVSNARTGPLGRFISLSAKC